MLIFYEWTTMNKLKTLFITSAIVSLLVLSGCGQTGPLYMPDDAKKTG
ncbi:MAG: putative small lipoprotein YifL [Kiritimatiellia bacterium]|jgi:predicted small lipoprotein YifL